MYLVAMARNPVIGIQYTAIAFPQEGKYSRWDDQELENLHTARQAAANELGGFALQWEVKLAGRYDTLEGARAQAKYINEGIRLNGFE